MSNINGWTEYRLDEIAVIQGGGTPSRKVEEYFGGDIPWVTPTDLPAIGQVGILGDVRETITAAGLAKSSAKLIPAGAVLFSSRASVGKIALTTQPCATNQGFANFIPHADRVDQSFLAFLLARYTSEIVSLAGKTTFLEVPRGKLRAYRVVVPSLDEQRRIVGRIKECLSRVDEIDTLRTESIAEANVLAPSLYSAIEGENKWLRKPVGEIIHTSRNGRSIKQGNGTSNGSVLTLTAVRDVTLDFKAAKSVSIPKDVAAQFSIAAGDVFVSRSNTRELVGLASVATGSPQARLIYPDLLIKLAPNLDLVRPRFLAYALRASDSRRQIKERALGSSQTMVKISGERLKEVEVPVPPLHCQDALISQFDELHEMAASVLGEMKSIEIARVREAILRKAFAGEL